MAKLYSSIRQEDIQEIERDVKSVFSIMAKGNETMCRQITEHIRLYLRRNSVDDKIRLSLSADEYTVALWQADLDKLNEKWDMLVKRRDFEYIRLILRFCDFINRNGLFKLSNLIDFALWLQTTPENTSYESYRR